MTVYDSIPVTVTGGTLSDAEIAAYVKHSKKTYPNRKIEQLSIQVDGDFVDLRCQFAPENFERIRRITGGNTRPLQRCEAGRSARQSEAFISRKRPNFM